MSMMRPVRHPGSVILSGGAGDATIWRPSRIRGGHMAIHAPTLQPVGGAGEFSGDGPYPVSAAGVDLVLLRAAGKLRAFEGRCPHQGALLGEGELDGDHLVCRNHQWRFSIETGARAGGMQV